MTWLVALRDRYRVAADPLRTERRIELVLLLLVLLLCLQLVYSASRLALKSVPEAVVPAADTLQVKSALRPDTITAGQSNEVRSRPLFWASRRALEGANSPVQEVAVQEVKDIKLVGVFGGGDTAGIIALVRGKKRRVLLGEVVDGWTLESVDADAAVLTAGERQENLVLQPGRVNAAVAGNTSNKRARR